VLLTEGLLQGTGVLNYTVKPFKRFSTGNPSAKSTHPLCDCYCLLRGCDASLIRINMVMPLPFPRERAVPAGAPANSGNKENHFGPFMAEFTAGGWYQRHGYE